MATLWRSPFGASRRFSRGTGRGAPNLAALTAVRPDQTDTQAGYVVARNAADLNTVGPTTLTAPLISSGEQVFAPVVTAPSLTTLTAPVITSTTGFPDATKPYQGAILPLRLGNMPHISRGKPIYGSGTVSKMNDGGYGYTTVTPGAWAAANGDWVAINVGAGPTQVLVAISNDGTALGSGTYLTSVFADYRFQVSNDSTNGSDGTWTTVVTVTGNPAMNREHKFSFTGYSWVKLICDSISGGQLDELDIWDASAGTDNTFAFLGDSLSVRGTQRNTYFGGGVQPSFQEDVLTNSGSYPLQLSVGVSGQSAAGWATNIASALALFPDVKYWCVGIGMNDGATMPSGLATWRTNMQTIIDAILADGRVPILTRISWTGSASYGGGAFDTCGLGYLNENGIEWLLQQYGASVRRGPDLYKLFYDNQVAFDVVTDPHWNEAGTIGWADAWADSLGVDPNRYLGAPLISAGSQVYVPTIIRDALGPPVISSTEQLYVPYLSQTTPNNAVRIDAYNDSFTLASLPGASFPLTFTGWAYISTDRNTYSSIFAIENAGASQYNELITEADGTTLALYDHATGSIQTLGAMTVGAWYKVAVVFTSGGYATYFGTETGALTKATGTIANVGTVASVGFGSTSLSLEFFNGRMAHYRVWTAALSDSEIDAEFHSSTPVRSSNLLGAWFPRDLTAATANVAISGSNLNSRGAATYVAEAGPLLQFLPSPNFISSGAQLYAPVVTQASGATTLTPPLITSTAALYGPSLTNLSTLTAPLLSSTATTYNPTLTSLSTLTAPLIGSTAVLYGPTLTAGPVTLTAPLIGSTAVLYGPTLTAGPVTLTAPLLASTAVLYGPTLTAGPVTLTAPLLASTAVLYGPTLTAGPVTLTAPLIGSTEALYGPSLTASGSLAAAFISSGSQTFNPVLTNLSTLTAPLLSSTAVLYGPSVGTGLTAPLIASASVLYNPSLTNLSTLTAPLVSNTNSFFGPSLTNLSTLTAPLLSSTAVLYGPTLSSAGSLSAPLLSNSNVLYGPTLTAGPVTLTAPLVTSTAVLYAPAVGQFSALQPPVIDSTVAVYAPSLLNLSALTAPLIGSTAQVFAGAVGSTLSAPLLTNGNVLYGPTLTAGPVTLTAPPIASTAALYAPVLSAGASTLVAPLLASTAQLFAPALASSISPPAIASSNVFYPASLTGRLTLTAPLIASTAQAFAPAVSAALGVPFIPSGSQTFGPTLTARLTLQPSLVDSSGQFYGPVIGGGNTISPPFVASTATFFGASVGFVLSPPLLASTAQEFGPNLTLGAGWPAPTETLPLVKSLELPLPATLTRIMGIHQSDIIIRSAIEAGLADLRANPWLLDYVFASLPQDVITWRDYGEKSVQEAKKWFVNTHIPVSVMPRLDESKWPQITIELLESSEVVPETTIGDVNYEPEEENDSTWPALTPQFTPVSYVPSTGLVKLAAAPEAWMAKGMYIVDRQGQAHEIIDVIDDKTFKIDPGTVADFRMATIKGHRPTWKVAVESSSFKESYRIGIHVSGEPVHLTWLHAIVQFALLRYKQVLMEARGFERSTFGSSQVSLNERIEAENILSRYVTVTGYVRQFWPKAVSRVIDGVDTTIQVGGVNKDMTVEPSMNPDDMTWVGNLDTIRRR